MSSILFFDMETSGLDPKRHAPLQIAWIIEKNGEIESRQCYDIMPDRNDDLCLAALETNGFTLERIKSGKDLSFVLMQLKLDCLPFDGIFPVGHNVQFDIDFLKAAADRRRENLFMYLDLKRGLDTRAIAQFLSYKCKIADLHGNRPENFKLTTLCELYAIPIKPHDAMEDVQATRTLFHILETL